MPWSNNIMTAPLSIADIASALGSSSLDLGTLVQDQMGLSNMWARYKPIIHTNTGYVTEAQRRSANFGLSASQYTLPNTAAQNQWTYSPPLTGPYRMFDYVKVTDAGVPSTTIGYTNNDVAPCRGFYTASDPGNQLTLYTYNSGATTEDDIDFYAITTGNDYGIGFAEMGGIADWYLCIAVDVVKNSTTTRYMVTSSQKIGAGASDPTVTTWQTVPIPKSSTIFSAEATYNAYAVLANKSKSSWYNVASDSSLRFMPLPVTTPSIARFQFHVNVGNYAAWVSSAYRPVTGTTAEKRKIYYTLVGMNSTGQAISSDNLRIQLDLYSTTAPSTTISTFTYSNTTSPTSGIPNTGGATTVLDFTGDHLGSTSVPSAASGTLHIKVTGKNLNGTTLFTSDTAVTDGPPAPEPVR